MSNLSSRRKFNYLICLVRFCLLSKHLTHQQSTKTDNRNSIAILSFFLLAGPF